MSKFKIGDWVIRTKDGEGNFAYHGGVLHKPYKIKGFTDVGVGDEYLILSELMGGYGFIPEYFEKAPINNKLNRKLYPNWKECDGYLTPPKEAAEQSEQSE